MVKLSEIQIKVTRDYSLFKFFDSNRQPNHAPKLAESIEKRDLTRFVPILVLLINGIRYIVDGQGRFLAKKMLGLPVYFIEAGPKDLSESDIAVLNRYQKNWSPMDYLNFYCEHGYEAYKRMKATLAECEMLTVSDLYQRVKQDGRGGGGNTTQVEVFQSGKSNFDKPAQTKARLVNSIMTELKNHARENLKHRSSIVGAVCSIVHSGINVNELISQIRKYPELILSQSDQPSYVVMLNEVYNFRKRDKNRVYFRKDGQVIRQELPQA